MKKWLILCVVLLLASCVGDPEYRVVLDAAEDPETTSPTVEPTPAPGTSPTEPLFDGSGNLAPEERQELIDRLEYAATRSSPLWEELTAEGGENGEAPSFGP